MSPIVVKVEVPVEGKKQKHHKGYHYYWSKDRKTWHTSIENQRAIRADRKIRQIEAFLRLKLKNAQWANRKAPTGALPAEFGGVNPQIIIDRTPLSQLKRTYVCVKCRAGLPEAPALFSGDFHDTRGETECFEYLRPGNEPVLKMRLGKTTRIELAPEEWRAVAQHAQEIGTHLDAYEEYLRQAAERKALLDAELERDIQTQSQ